EREQSALLAGSHGRWKGSCALEPGVHGSIEPVCPQRVVAPSGDLNASLGRSIGAQRDEASEAPAGHAQSEGSARTLPGDRVGVRLRGTGAETDLHAIAVDAQLIARVDRDERDLSGSEIERPLGVAL